MKKRFNAKKAKKNKKPLILFIFIVGFFISFSLVYKSISINLSEEVIINYILNNSDKEISFEKIITPEFLLNYTFNAIVVETNAETVLKEEETISDPLVYIYNTHPTEYYAESTYEIFNITPTVITASYILKEYLSSYGITAIVEEKSATDILRDNSWSYSKSYAASRIILEEAIESYPTVEYYIDIHRDAAEKETTTMQINGENCARFMFVIGKEYETYEKNYSLASSINDKLNEVAENYTRGIILKEGEYVDGVYNQDLNENAILIETGAQYNTIEEVSCAMEHLSKALSEVINGE